MDWIWYGVGAGTAIAVLVVVHEFGHFIVAKLFGVGVPTFSIGMGPRILGFRLGETDYRLSVLPIGGYVQMSGADPYGEEEFGTEPVPPEKDFMKKPVWQRLLILLAGPVANLILPVLLFSVVFMSGWPTRVPVFGQVEYESLAYQAGIRIGDRVVAVNDDPIGTSAEFVDALAAHAANGVNLTIERGDNTVEVALGPEAIRLESTSGVDLEHLGAVFRWRSTRFGIDDAESPAAKAGLRSFDLIREVDGTAVNTWEELQAALTPDVAHTVRYARREQGAEAQEGTVTLAPNEAWSPRADDAAVNAFGMVPAELYIGELITDFPAGKAGIKPEDRVYAINGTPVRDFRQIGWLVHPSQEPITAETVPQPVTVDLVRDGARFSTQLTPKIDDQPGIFGTKYRMLIGFQRVSTATWAGEPTVVRYDPLTATIKAVRQTRVVIIDTATALGNIFRGKLNPRDSLGGPVAIFTVAGRSFMAGFQSFAMMIGAISVSLGLINLLPVPALDGGQIVVYLTEWVRGRPLSAALRMRIQMIGVIVLFSLIILVTANDIGRLLFPGV